MQSSFIEFSYKMLSLLAITLAIQLATANDFLGQCNLDRYQQVGDDLVIDVLKAFYDDLVFVGAATDRLETRDYNQTLGEMQNFLSALPSSDANQIKHGVELLTNNQYGAHTLDSFRVQRSSDAKILSKIFPRRSI